METSSEKNTFVVKKGHLNKISQINDSIEQDQERLNDALEKINKASAPVNVKSFIGLAKNNSVQESLTKVYDELSNYIEECGEAIRSTNNNLVNVLDLVAILTKIEADLYEKIGSVSLGKRKLLEKFDQYCEEQNINNENVKELLKISLQRDRSLLSQLNNLNKKTDRIQQYLGINNKVNFYTKTINSLWFKTVISLFAIGSFVILVLQYFKVNPF